jgi:hypothetical protein
VKKGGLRYQVEEYLLGNSTEAPWQLQLYFEMEATGNQHLPFAGGLLDQPYWLTEDLRLVRLAVKSIEDKKVKQRKAKELFDKLSEK